MRCPYCESTNCVPDHIKTSIIEYGSRSVSFNCLQCKKRIKATGLRIATFGNPEKTNEESNW